MEGGSAQWLESSFGSAPCPETGTNFVPLPLLILWVLCAVFYLLNDTIRASSNPPRLLDKSSGSSNTGKFKAIVSGSAGADARKRFVADSRKEVEDMKERMGFVRLPTAEPDPVSPRRPLLGAGTSDSTFGSVEDDVTDPELFRQYRARHEAHQEEQLGKISQSVDSLKDVSNRIAVEIDDQAIIIDDMNEDAGRAKSKLDIASQKVAKLLGLSTERRQWLAISGLTDHIAMTSSGPILKSGYLKAPLYNGVGRFVCQLQRLTLKFCKEHGGSRGVRDFIEQDLLNFARRNPGVVMYVKPRRHRSPVLKAEFLNGEHHWLSLHSMDREEVHRWIELMRTKSGEQMVRLRKQWYTDTPSIQGVWNPFTHTDPALNVVEFPSEKLSVKAGEVESASDFLEKLLAEQKNIRVLEEDVPRQGSLSVGSVS